MNHSTICVIKNQLRHPFSQYNKSMQDISVRDHQPSRLSSQQHQGWCHPTPACQDHQAYLEARRNPWHAFLWPDRRRRWSASLVVLDGLVKKLSVHGVILGTKIVRQLVFDSETVRKCTILNSRLTRMWPLKCSTLKIMLWVSPSQCTTEVLQLRHLDPPHSPLPQVVLDLSRGDLLARELNNQ